MPDLPAIAAATLIVMRDVPTGPPEIAMVERAQAMAFAGGALVFPGGRVDTADRTLAQRFGGDADDIAARIAAIRETIEEAGIAIGLSRPLDAPAIRALGSDVYGGVAIGDALDSRGVSIDPAALTPFARWLPKGVAHRIFDTSFYIARAPVDAPQARVDGGENVRLIWASAQAILDDADAGRCEIIFPTRRNLERLARFANVDAALVDAAACPVTTVTPWIEERGGDRFLCIPEGLGYPITAERLDAVRRA
ncbi:NUDIX hydrolase [Sphingomonas japonica]|uniref:8-oxo-dGTP pyrophosphatase MutT (NUDIX family) n=1 Tax=Sphingomonas japonica TaxID=511662 RepID=A0ABX0U513_9SPHN|nr:NUDIX hydrolase [Sphingomonas japonica]NIJ23868.1 8-oxo-dGTP pyrophosphatase MutT (NUDIX family) [Sphingomonas japonica]